MALNFLAAVDKLTPWSLFFHLADWLAGIRLPGKRRIWKQKNKIIVWDPVDKLVWDLIQLHLLLVIFESMDLVGEGGSAVRARLVIKWWAEDLDFNSHFTVFLLNWLCGWERHVLLGHQLVVVIICVSIFMIMMTIMIEEDNVDGDDDDDTPARVLLAWGIPQTGGKVQLWPETSAASSWALWWWWWALLRWGVWVMRWLQPIVIMDESSAAPWHLYQILPDLFVETNYRNDLLQDMIWAVSWFDLSCDWSPLRTSESSSITTRRHLLTATIKTSQIVTTLTQS